MSELSMPTNNGYTGLAVAQLAVAVLGVLAVTGEYSSGMIQSTLVAVPWLLPNSRLVSSDSWGHTALLTSACVDNTVWDYLIHPLAPAPKITRCRGDVQPFAPSPSTP